MRTSGPLRPSGRSPVSTSKAGRRWACRAVRAPVRRPSPTTSPRPASSTPSAGSHTNITSASGPVAQFARRRAGPSRCTAIAGRRAARRVLSGSPPPVPPAAPPPTSTSARVRTSVTSSMPSRSADATRASSCRRSVRAAAIARAGVRRAAPPTRPARAPPCRGRRRAAWVRCGPSAYSWITSSALISSSGT